MRYFELNEVAIPDVQEIFDMLDKLPPPRIGFGLENPTTEQMADHLQSALSAYDRRIIIDDGRGRLESVNGKFIHVTGKLRVPKESPELNYKIIVIIKFINYGENEQVNPRLWTVLKREVKELLSHEFTHLKQYQKRKWLDTISRTAERNRRLGRQFRGSSLYGSEQEYLGNKDEIEAHARGAVQELLDLGYDRNAIVKILRDKSQWVISPTLEVYKRVTDPKVLNRLIKKIIQYLDVE